MQVNCGAISKSNGNVIKCIYAGHLDIRVQVSEIVTSAREEIIQNKNTRKKKKKQNNNKTAKKRNTKCAKTENTIAKFMIEFSEMLDAVSGTSLCCVLFFFSFLLLYFYPQ